MKSLSLLLVLLGAAAAVQAFAGEPLFQEFSQWARKHHKSYASMEETKNRFQIYKENIMRVARLRENKLDNATYTMTQFADMSREEFHKFPCGGALSKLNGLRPNFRVNISKPLAPRAVPTSWDWTTKGAVTPIKNQGQCGSCWAFSTIGNIEGVNFLANKRLVSLSEQEEVDCTTTSQGCDGGWPYWAMSDLLTSYGGQVDTESGYPYTAQDGQCAFSSGSVGATITGYTSYCTESTPACSEAQIMQLLYTYGPLSVCLDADGMQFYNGGVQNPSDCDGQIDHCVTMVGYGTDSGGTPYWKIKNSWGTGWGENGYYRLIRGGGAPGACSIQQVVTVAKV